MTLPHVLKRIRLNLARSKEFPSGSARHGYEFVAPLDAKGHIDPQLWQKYREHCGVRRFWEGEDDELVSQADVQRLRESLSGATYPAEIVVYPGAGHAFMNDTRPAAYRPDTAHRAWSRLLSFLHHELR